MLIYENGNVRYKEYWQLQPAPYRISYTEIFEILSNAIKKRLISDVPIGVFLSGGIDSSTIVAISSKFMPTKTFTVGYEARFVSYNELYYARIVKNTFNTQHHELIVKPNIHELLQKIVYYLDEPFGDSSAVPTYIISRFVRKKIVVALSGIGGDEVFGGYPRYIGMLLMRHYRKIPQQLREFFAKISERFRESYESVNVIGWLKRFLRGATFPPDMCYISFVSFLRSGWLKKLLNFSVDIDVFSCHRKIFNTLNDELMAMFYLDMKTYLTDDLLFMADRMSMANSLELRVPFCDHKLLEVMLALPPTQKLKGYKLKSLFKSLLHKKHILPQEILTRRKQGFMIPLPYWVAGELRQLIHEKLSKTQLGKHGLVNYKFVEEILNAHYSRKSNFADLIWALLIFQMWLENFSS